MNFLLKSNSYKPPFFFRFFDQKYLMCSIPSTERIIYLTFDDGPIPEVTPIVLDILKERNIKATFFCVGDNVKKYPEVFAQVLNAGHVVGNHTFHHLNGWKTPPAEYYEDMMRCDEFFRTNLFRPPYGRFSLSQYFLLRKKYRIILWSVLSGDYRSSNSKEKCLSTVLNHTESGSIVVFHDSLKAKDNMLFTLPRFLDHFLAEGYRFETIPTS